jgi:transcriptional repressor NrdR
MEEFLMRCPFCGFEESKVIDSRPTDENERIRRRRECLQCSKRFTTYETIEDVPIIVVKKDKSREVFDRNKILKGMLRACEKRSVTVAELETAISEIEATLQSAIDREVTSVKIGELIMEKLKQIDEVAYIRFASVYKEFDSVEAFRDEISKM